MSAASMLPDFHLGWQLIDPGPPPFTSRLNQVPFHDDPATLRQLHEQWKRACEAENRQLEQAHHQSTAVWFPVMPSKQRTLPFYGGSERTLQAAVVTLTAALGRSGFARIRIANLLRSNPLERLLHVSRARPMWATTRSVISPDGSSIDVFAATSPVELAGIVADLVRRTPDQQGRLEAGRAERALLDVAALLSPPVDLARLTSAVGFALTGRAPSWFGAPAFTPAERTSLQEFNSRQVTVRQGLQQVLDQLEQDLQSLLQFARSPARPPERLGNGPALVTILEIETAGNTNDFELGRDILARYVARTFDRPASPGPLALILMGADDLPKEVLDSLVSAATRYGHQLLLFFQRLQGVGHDLIGRGVGANAVLFTLAHPKDRTEGAELLGREFKFVVNGHSLAEGTSTEWSSSTTMSQDQSTTRTRQFGELFGGSVSRGFSKGSSMTSGTGGGRNRSVTVSTQRVHEYVVEPEVFRDIPEMTMLVIQAGTVTVADCNPAIWGSPITSRNPHALP